MPPDTSQDNLAKDSLAKDSMAEEISRFLAEHPDVEAVDLLLPDMCGVLRGKQVGRDALDKLVTEGVRLPGSIYLTDATGENSPFGRFAGHGADPDYFCFPVPGTLKPVPWAGRPMGQVIASMQDADGNPFFADPRNVLKHAAAPLGEMRLTPVVAIELEFYLTQVGDDGIPKLATIPRTGAAQQGVDVYSIEALYDFEGFFGEVLDACKAQGIPADMAVSEYAPGQFEINLHHVADPVAACDHAALLKRVVKGIARTHGMIATFMAKPFAGISGSGMHLHVSAIDGDGNNVFAADAPAEGGLPVGEKLRHAIGGLMETVRDGFAVFAPNANSYRRFQPDQFAPVTALWGVNNRSVAIRIPPSDAAGMRLEHRIAGADANPYLVLAAVLAGIHRGLEGKIQPPDATSGDGYEKPGPTFPARWEEALGLFEASTAMDRYLGETYTDAFHAIRKYEADRFHSQIQPLDYAWYLRSA